MTDDEAYTIHMALVRTLLPRNGYPEGFTRLQQQQLLLHILTHQPFDIVDLILAEIEDVIIDGMGECQIVFLCTLDQLHLFDDLPS